MIEEALLKSVELLSLQGKFNLIPQIFVRAGLLVRNSVLSFLAVQFSSLWHSVYSLTLVEETPETLAKSRNFLKMTKYYKVKLNCGARSTFQATVTNFGHHCTLSLKSGYVGVHIHVRLCARVKNT